MYVTIYYKDDEELYYKLNVCDQNTKIWAERFINTELAYALINNGIKSKTHYIKEK